MIIARLYPRCPFENEDEKLKTINDTFASMRFKSIEERREAVCKLFPEYKEYQRWFWDRESILMIVATKGKEFFIGESEYLRVSKEWNEYKEQEYQLIVVQKIPYDSPKWQAVIEKYRRKDR